MSNQDPAPTEDNNQFDINESTYKTSHAAVRKARRFALQGLYEWLMTDHRFEQSGKGEWKENAPHDIAARTRANNAMHTVHLGYYHSMMRDIPEQIEALEELIAKHLDREIDKIDMVEHAVLLIGAYELKQSLHIPYKVVLDEAMKLNTHFGATDAHKLINAVMDKMAAELREAEVAADTGAGYKQKKQQENLVAKASSNASDKLKVTEGASAKELETDIETHMATKAGTSEVKGDENSKEPIGNDNSTVEQNKVEQNEAAASKPAKPRIGRNNKK